MDEEFPDAMKQSEPTPRSRLERLGQLARIRARLARDAVARRGEHMTRAHRLHWPLLAATLIALGGTAAFAIAARSVAHNDAAKARIAFDAASDATADTLELDLQHEADLELAANGFVVDHTHPTVARFATWGRAVQIGTRYPELTGIAWIVLVPAAKLPSFSPQPVVPADAERPGARGAVFPAGKRAQYCLARMELGPNAAVVTPSDYDLCAGTRLLATRDAGSLLVFAAASELSVASPVYRGGGVPATVAARRRDFLGWTAVSVDPTSLLGLALGFQTDTELVLRRSSGASTLVFRLGQAPPARQSTTIDLNNGATLEVIGSSAGGGIFGDSSALLLLIGGLVLSALFALLILALGTGRARAMRLVEVKTRELAAEALLIAEARDDAVEASNAKSVFVATISHELRTPLSGVIGTTELLLETQLDLEQQEYAEIVRSSSEGLLLVINDILDYSKIEAGKLELDPTGFAPSELIAECCALLLPLARDKGIALTVETDPSFPGWAFGDAARLRQVLINLLSNAVKFTEDGQVTVHAAAKPTSDDESLLRIEVTDTGIGIDEPTLARLFQPFTQADSSTARKYGGTGLGLTISARLIELMGGTLAASSTPGVGSTFWFEVALPLADRSDQSDQQGDAHPTFSALGVRDAAGHLTDAAPLVLVADDNPVNQMLASRLLDKCGYRSEVVANGNEALKAVDGKRYAAILMDCQMPEMDGYTATRAIRSREEGHQHVPIIATTAHSMSGDREACIAAGMDNYISKPIRVLELRDVLERSIAASAAAGSATS
jgi:signal transduction histidine kinase/CheY-like chemotaxis protein